MYELPPILKVIEHNPNLDFLAEGWRHGNQMPILKSKADSLWRWNLSYVLGISSAIICALLIVVAKILGRNDLVVILVITFFLVAFVVLISNDRCVELSDEIKCNEFVKAIQTLAEMLDTDPKDFALLTESEVLKRAEEILLRAEIHLKSNWNDEDRASKLKSFRDLRHFFSQLHLIRRKGREMNKKS